MSLNLLSYSDNLTNCICTVFFPFQPFSIPWWDCYNNQNTTSWNFLFKDLRRECFVSDLLNRYWGGKKKVLLWMIMAFLILCQNFPEQLLLFVSSWLILFHAYCKPGPSQQRVLYLKDKMRIRIEKVGGKNLFAMKVFQDDWQYTLSLTGSQVKRSTDEHCYFMVRITDAFLNVPTICPDSLPFLLQPFFDLEYSLW